MEQPAGHAAEPAAGTFRTPGGRVADLFTLAHYPVDAVCQVCQGAIRARSFALPFEHLEPGTMLAPPEDQAGNSEIARPRSP